MSSKCNFTFNLNHLKPFGFPISGFKRTLKKQMNKEK